MHGEIVLPRSKRLLWGINPADEHARGAVAAFDRAHNIFPASNPDQRFRAGGPQNGLIDADGVIADQAELHRMMKALATAVERASWAVRPDNTSLPSGYTYLLQFIAHDMTESVSSFAREPGAVGKPMRPAGLNGRMRVLLLDTLYGAGPETHGQAYALGPSPGAGLPRTRLRVSPVMNPKDLKIQVDRTTRCPFRDLTRNECPREEVMPDDTRRYYSEALVADRRNDTHALISQLTVLFALLHNTIVDRLALAIPSAFEADLMRVFLCARAMVTEIYRFIIVHDVLPRIVDERIGIRYGYKRELSTLFDGKDGVPVEFRFGAFRFGHSLVRDSYKVNSDKPIETERNLQFNSVRSPAFALPLTDPLRQAWLVDWARFFDIPGGPTPNYTKLIGPRYAGGLRMGGVQEGGLPPLSDMDGVGLPNRDLLSASYSACLSVPTMIDKFRPMVGVDPKTNEYIIWPYDEWKARIGKWLDDYRFTEPVCGGTPEQRQRIVDDPPLPFFILFEAEQAAGGRTLGPLGSVIVADTIIGALLGQPTGFEKEGPTLKSRLVAIAKACFDDNAAQWTKAVAVAESIPEITSMPELLALVATGNGFTELLQLR